jgi:hypothetical protein
VDDDRSTASMDDDGLRPFGLAYADDAPRTGRQRTRSAVRIGIVVVVAGGLIAGTLAFVVSSVQSGIGGLFPQPGAALTRFEDAAQDMPDVATATDLAQRQTAIFAGYDVVALVRAEDGLTDAEQRTLVDELSERTDLDTGNGVSVYAQAQFGDLRVAVSPDTKLTDQRLALGQQVAAMGGVASVACGWSTTGGKPIEDVAAKQVVTVGTTASDADYPGVVTAVTNAVHAGLPDARVTVTRTSASG